MSAAEPGGTAEPGGGAAPGGERGPWPRLRALLDAQGFRPSRRLGQNFLLDDPTCRRIVASAELAPGDRVLEVGVGLGFLTRPLLAAGLRVLAVEVDPRLAELARAELGPPRERHAAAELELVVADALAGKHALAPELVRRLPADGPWHVVANLPYAIASPLLAELARLPAPPTTLTVLVQLEVAERLAAPPGGKAWGALGARLQARYAARRLFRVPAGSFRPRPQVESAVVRLERRADALAGPEGDRFDAWVGKLFEQRRKQVATTLAAALGDRAAAEAALRAAGVDPAARVEVLDVAALRRLAAALPPP